MCTVLFRPYQCIDLDEVGEGEAMTAPKEANNEGGEASASPLLNASETMVEPSLCVPVEESSSLSSSIFFCQINYSVALPSVRRRRRIFSFCPWPLFVDRIATADKQILRNVSGFFASGMNAILGQRNKKVFYR